MIHYFTENRGLGDLVTAYPHSPENQDQSIVDYLEDKLANGYELVSFSWYDTGYMRFIFKVVAK